MQLAPGPSNVPVGAPSEGRGVLTLTSEQEQAAARRSGSLLLAAGAGSGKTSVLTERFVRAVREDGFAPARILAITFTERAAGELRERIRARLLELGERDAAREAEAAFISTFHGFCARLLRSHPLPAGLDPSFAVMEEGLAGRLQRLAFADALAGFVDGEPADAVELVAAYGAHALERVMLDVHAQLRSQGQTVPRLPTVTLPRLPTVAVPRLPTVAGEERAEAACRLIDELLGRFGQAYRARKRARAAVDFDDLELLARDLLRDHADIRETWAERFHMLMVDELQDTNPRQLELLEMLDRDNLFTVGDELQSIYGFRHAQVELFRQRRTRLGAVGAALRLTHNFRSAAPILAAVERVFSARMGEGYTGLVPAREPPGAADDQEPVVELLLSDTRGWECPPGEPRSGSGASKSPAHGEATHWRAAEARLLAARVAELVERGQTQPGDVAVLVRALGDLPLYESALQAAGLSTLAAVGGFWAHQQVGETIAYLRALANPLDELALFSTLACPLVGLSSDALALVAMTARERRCGAWQAIERHGDALDALLSPSDSQRLDAFRDWFAAERRSAPLRPLADMLRRAIALAGYDVHVLSLPWGNRRLANVHKLIRLARAYEAQEGRDLRGFLDHVAHLGQALGAREAYAPSSDDGIQAVRLMSVHAAKGLEFPVVCVADLGRAPRLTVPDLIVERNGRLGMRLPVLGEPQALPVLAFEELRAESLAAQQQEEDRILYVAMTRARDRLLLSGAAAFERWPVPKQGSPPIAWLGPALVPDLAELAQAGVEVTVDLGEGLRVRCTFNRPSSLPAAEPTAPGDVLPVQAPARGSGTEQLSLDGSGPEQRSLGDSRQEQPPARGSLPARSLVQPPLAVQPPLRDPNDMPLADPDATISYSSLVELERCGYRYYLERVLRLGEDRTARLDGADGGMQARARGTIVHALLESIDFARPRSPTEKHVVELARRLGLRADRQMRAEILALLQGALSSEPAKRLAAADRTRREHPFTFSLGPDRPLVTGVLDLIVREREGTVVVVDYKSDRLQPDDELQEIVARDYEIQRLIYALAAIESGAERVEVAHWFLERPDEWVGAGFTAGDRHSLREQLLERIERLDARGFAVAPMPHRGICLTCPGRRALCSWGESHTLRVLPDALETRPDALETHERAATLT